MTQIIVFSLKNSKTVHRSDNQSQKMTTPIPVYARLQNSKHYSVYRRRVLNTKAPSNNNDDGDGNPNNKNNNRKHNGSQEYFESPITQREWWRVMLRETPVPGTYEYQDFLEENNNRPTTICTASFRAEARKNHRGNHGEYLLPGAYQYNDFIEDLRKKKTVSAFKSSGRAQKLAWERSKTETDTFPVPGQYETTFPPVPTQTVASSMFKSKTIRFNHLFNSKEGPPPGKYNPKDVITERKAAKSSFKSKAPRFKSSGTNVPGPGTYETDRYDRYLNLSIGHKRIYTRM